MAGNKTKIYMGLVPNVFAGFLNCSKQYKGTLVYMSDQSWSS